MQFVTDGYNKEEPKVVLRLRYDGNGRTTLIGTCGITSRNIMEFHDGKFRRVKYANLLGLTTDGAERIEEDKE